jgi:hypothetical protein
VNEPGFDLAAACAGDLPDTLTAEITPAPAEPAPSWRAGAGRKGAKRIHELIELGRRYEADHGLKQGRQRLRQLIELGKLYEAEHGLARPPRERRRRTKGERAELLADLVRLLRQVCRPSYRAELDRLAAALTGQPPPTGESHGDESIDKHEAGAAEGRAGDGSAEDGVPE